MESKHLILQFYVIVNLTRNLIDGNVTTLLCLVDMRIESLITI